MVVNVTAIRTGAAGISRLLAGQELDGDDWERAVVVLVRCREERKRLDDRVLQIDASIARLRGHATLSSEIVANDPMRSRNRKVLLEGL